MALSRASLLLRSLRYLRQGRTGDAAACQGAAFGATPNAETERRLRALAEPFPAIDLGALAALPEDSFGAHYARFMTANGLRPFQVSPELAEELREAHLLSVRYPLLHDAFHVLLGYDASRAGELGVWCFVAAQQYSPAYDRAARLGRLLYPLIAPHRLPELREAAATGERLGREADCVIAAPLELWWASPLREVRSRLRLSADTATTVSG